jgi:predicted ATPase/HPt (histidine-containing phosphotransfer) domain-containing protein
VCARIHAARVIHRDIKPANVLYDPSSETIALADFGIAAELPVHARSLPVGDLVGTPGYVSPEHTGRMSQGCDVRSDLYSLGVTLYELLTGALPFADRPLLEVIAAQLSKLPEPPHHRVPAIPPVVSELVMKLLAKRADDRYQSARGLAVDLERCVAELTSDGRIASFALGQSDLRRVRFPARLFGRTAELEVLAEAHARAATGAPTLVVISGREGSGRGELVRALIRDRAPDSPLALGGWRSADDRPLSGLGEALGSLAGSLLRLDEDHLIAVREQFARRVGRVGQVVLDLVPALADVFGDQPALPVLAPGPTRARLQFGLRCLAGALGDAAPLVLVLGGFEHVAIADPAAVGLIEALLDPATSCRLLIVLIAHEPAGFGALGDRAAASIELGALPVAAVAAWAGAALDCDPADAAELGELLHGRTAGNPLMVMRLLEHLVETGAIERRSGRYTWELERVRAAPPPKALGALAAQRIAELDDATRLTLAAIAATDDPVDLPALAAMRSTAVDAVHPGVAALAREGLVIAEPGGYRIAHPEIARTALATIASSELSWMRGRLGSHLLAGAGPAPSRELALRIAIELDRGAVVLAGADRVRAAELYVIAAEHLISSVAYAAAVPLLDGAAVLLLDHRGDPAHRALQFRGELGRARALMMLGRHAEADAQFCGIAAGALSVAEIGMVYPAWCDHSSMRMNRARTIELGIEGLARLGIALPAEPTRLRALAAIRLNQRKLGRLTAADHIERPLATDEHAVAGVNILSALTTATLYSRRMELHVMVTETALGLVLAHGHLRNTQGFLALHGCFLHAMHGEYVAARKIYHVARRIDEARPAPELIARTAVVHHYLLGAWFRPWRECSADLATAISRGVEAGDPGFAAMCASASIAMLTLVGTPFDELAAAVEGWGPFIRAEGGVAANAANIVNIAGKLSRGEPVLRGDLDRVTHLPVATGAMRNNAMVNLGLALSVCGHEGQVRAWFDEIRDSFPEVNFSQPYALSMWLLDALFAAKDARNGRPERRADAASILQRFRALREGTGATESDPAMALIEAQLARGDGELDRAAGLFGRAAHEARIRQFTHLVAYAHEERAQMLERAGLADEAALYYREAVLAYRRWAHLTKALELEHAHPELRVRDLLRDDGRRAGIRRVAPPATLDEPSASGTRNDQLDLMTVLQVSQDISTQLHDSGIVRAVLTGIAENAGAERVVLVMRDAAGVEIVHGEVHAGDYRDVAAPLDGSTALPGSVMRMVRRTGRPLVIADAVSDPAYASDPFVAAHRSRSIAVVPVRRKGEVVGFVVLENRMVAGAFTPQLVSLAQALVTQAAISLDNASLYKNLEDRVTERTAALHTRNNEMRMVLDHVAQGLAIVGTDGRLLGERSAVLATWFPEGVPGTLAGFFVDDPGSAAWFDIAWGQLIEGLMPVELGIQQLPTQLRRPDRTLAFAWQPIVNDAGGVERMLVVLSDVTCALRQVEVEREQKQWLAAFEQLSEDREAVSEFLKDTAATVGELTGRGVAPDAEKRLLHTLKGNAALFGLSALAARCHEIEDAMALDTRPMTDAERDRLAAAWQVLHDKLSRFTDVGDGMIQIRKAELEAVLAALRRDGSPVAYDVELWELEPMRVRLQRIAEQARALAERVGKGPIRVQVEHNGVYLGREPWAAFWSAFAHVVRNAIDHGFEDAAERAALGKGIATLTLRSYLRSGALVFELSDDGRGIAWDALADKARAAGLPAQTRQDLIAALFAGGVSTRSEVTELSGRGVGLGALAAVCRELGCEITIDSAPGQGTTMRFEAPGALARVRRDRPVARDAFAAAATEVSRPAID